ncbi:RNA polymerase sigma factor [Streptomyces sp. NPDC055749]
MAAYESDDAELLRAVAGGDRRAFEVFYSRYAPWLISRLQRRCPDRALVEDVVQETFVAVWRGADGFRVGSSGDAAGWLWRIGSRRLIDATRSHGARQSLFRRLTRIRGRGDEPSAEDQVLQDVRHGDLADALRRLPPELAAVLHATVVDGLTVKEAATCLGIPVGTVKTRAMRARRLLQQQLM